MKRSLCVLLILITLLALPACGNKSAAPSPTPAPTAAPTAAPTPEPTPEPTPAPSPEPLPLMPSLPPVHDEALNQILESVLSVHLGSAGCSLRAAKSAAWLLDWGAQTALSDDEIYSAVGCWLDEQDDARLQLFLESILSVYDRCYDLKGEHAEDLMADAGVTNSLYPWNDRAFRAAEMVMYGCGLR